MNQKTIKALKKAHTIKKLGVSSPNVWIETENGQFVQDVKDRNDKGKCYSEAEVDEMMDALDMEMVFKVPDNGRD